jgi:hypothetical protein
VHFVPGMSKEELIQREQMYEEKCRAIEARIEHLKKCSVIVAP